jgi:hypothetical protein
MFTSDEMGSAMPGWAHHLFCARNSWMDFLIRADCRLSEKFQHTIVSET